MRSSTLLVALALALLSACQDFAEPTIFDPDQSTTPRFSSAATGTERQITPGTGGNTPAISGDQFVWRDHRNGNWDIYLHDLRTGSERQITTSTTHQWVPDISGDRIVWQDSRSGNNDIYLFDLSTGIERQITTNTAHQVDPRISGNRIVWQDYRNGKRDIYLFDLSTGIERQITTSTADPSQPAISGDRIVWQDYRSGNNDIYLFDLSTGIERQITAGTTEQYQPDISGDRIVWQDSRSGNEDIYLFDLSTGIEQQITRNTAYQVDPAISGDRIVWQDSRSGNEDIYLFDLSTGIERQITTNTAYQGVPDISGDRIVWQDNRNESSHVYLYELSATTSDPNATPTGTDISVTPTDGTTGTASPTMLTFSSVTGSGTTSVTSGTVGGDGSPPPPGNFRLGQPPTYYDIQTTATYSGTITICVDYTNVSYGNEGQLKLLHYENGAWMDVTSSLDTQTNLICGTTTSLSPFLVAERNVAPVVSAVRLPSDPVAVNTPTTLSGSFTDENPRDAHTATIYWEGSTTDGTVTESNGLGTVAGTYTYAAAGVYTVSINVSDGMASGSGTSELEVPAYIVVYDPEAGFVTGGGWIDSPVGACKLSTCTDATMGKAVFGFVSRYKPGASTPDGNTEFHFKAGGLHFRSTAYQWLVVSGSRAQYKGEGTINGGGIYGFLITAIDGALISGGGTDKFRIKVWDKLTGTTVYDNQMGASEDSDAATQIGGGSIVVHK